MFSLFEPDVQVGQLRSTRQFVSVLLERELQEENLPAYTFGDTQSTVLVVAKTADRRVLGCMNDLAFFAEVFDMPPAEIAPRSRELLEFAGLTEFADRPAAALSGGMQKKLGLACALVHRPKVLLLDEPTGGVDPVARQEFWQLLIGLLRGGSGVLVSTPYMDEAMRFSRVVFMNHGRALTQDAPRELINRLAGRILELAAEPAIGARQIAVEDPEVQDVHSFGNYLHLRVASAEGPLARIPGRLTAAGIHVGHLLPVAPTLEDVFIQLLQTEGEGNGTARSSG